jgi:subtilisin family serine protease
VSPFTERKRSRTRRGVAFALVCFAAATVAAFTAETTRADPSLCVIVDPLGPILGCRETPPQGTGKTAPEQQAQSRAAAPALPEQEPPVASATPRFVDDLLLVRFRPGTSPQERQAALADAGVTAIRTIGGLGVTVVQMPPERREAALARLDSSRVVAHVERDAVLERLDTTPDDTDWPAQWGLRQIDLPAAWDRTRGSSGVVVAVLDTGVDGDLPDLRDAVVPGYNAVSPLAPPADDNGHGTSVAGVVAARTNNGQGIAGICWTCSVLSIKVLGADGTGDTALVAAGIVHAADAGARVISMSLGGPADDQTLDAAVAFALSKGAIVVAAAGNNGASTPFYPAAIPGVVSVAATDTTDHLYSWSNFGSWVQVAAPGCNPAPSAAGNYVMFCGTSSATPVVAGLLALLVSEQPGADRDTVVGALERTAVPIGDSVRSGRIDADAALAALATPSSEAAPPQQTPVAHSSTITLRGFLIRGSAVIRRTVETGPLAATLRFRPKLQLSLSIQNAHSALVARARGGSGLRLLRDLPRGTYTFVVRGPKRRTAFTLELTATQPT